MKNQPSIDAARHLKLAEENFATGQINDALTQAFEVLKLALRNESVRFDPSYLAAHKLLYLIYCVTGETQLAEDYFEQAVALGFDPDALRREGEEQKQRRNQLGQP